MANRSPRHLRPGNQNLRGKKSMTVRRYYDPVHNFKEETLKAIELREMTADAIKHQSGENNDDETHPRNAG